MPDTTDRTARPTGLADDQADARPTGLPTSPADDRAEVRTEADPGQEVAEAAPALRPRLVARHPVREGFKAYLRPYRWTICVSALMALGGAVLNLIGPSQLSKITNLVTEGLMGSIDLAQVQRLTTVLALLYALGLVLNYVQGYLMANVVQSTTRAVRQDLSRKFNRLPLSYLDSRSTGDVLSRVTNDVDTISQSMNQSMSSLVSSAALLVGSTVMMLWTNWVLALAGITSALLGMALTMGIMGRSQRYFQRQQEQLGALNAHVEETYGGFTVVKAFRGEERAARVMHERNTELYDSAWRSQFLSGLMMPLMIFIGNLSYVVVCVVGAVLAMDGSIEFGTIVAFMVYVRLFTQPLQTVGQVASSLQPMTAAARRVFTLLDEEEMGPEVTSDDPAGAPRPGEVVRGEVDVEHLRFGYTRDRVILHDLSARVEPGQKVAIVGPTGAGKTTIVNLLMRFYEADSGSIRIDGHDVTAMTRAQLRDLFGMVLQDTWTFQGTLRENLVYDVEGVSDERLDEICAATGITELVRQLPQGYDTLLDETVTLSAGQKQLMTIARAMVKDAPLLILDEATSSVDTRTEIQVQAAMDRLMHGRTSFVIAHRLSTIRDAGLILYLEGGDVKESGTHAELLERGGAYAALYNSQFDPA